MDGIFRSSIGALNSSAQEMIGNLFAFAEGGLNRYFKKKHIDLETNYAKKNIRGSYIVTLNHSVLSFINSITVAVLLCYGGYKVIMGTLSYGGLVTFNLYSQRFMSPILQMVDFNNTLTSCSISWQNVQHLLNAEISVKNGTEIQALQGNIKFDNVFFAYADKKPVLHDVSMEFKKGEIHALVGPSGVGKTTLIHLLFRLWDCKDGTITIDGINIKSLDTNCLRSQISIVSQNIFLLNDTIHNNIVLGNNISDSELQNILIQADILGFYLMKLPQCLTMKQRTKL